MGFGEPKGLPILSSLPRGLFPFHLLIWSQQSTDLAPGLGASETSELHIWETPERFPWTVVWYIRAVTGTGGE